MKIEGKVFLFQKRNAVIRHLENWISDDGHCGNMKLSSIMFFIISFFLLCSRNFWGIRRLPILKWRCFLVMKKLNELKAHWCGKIVFILVFEVMLSGKLTEILFKACLMASNAAIWIKSFQTMSLWLLLMFGHKLCRRFTKNK